MRKPLQAFFLAVLAVFLSHVSLIAQMQGGWTAVGNLKSPRKLGAAVPLGSGALVMGGMNVSTALASAEIYNASKGTWAVTGSMAAARASFPAVVLQNGKVLVEGGNGGTGVLAGAELYDPATGTWSSAGSLSVARQNHTATLLQYGKVLVTGGCTLTTCRATTNVAELYDPATNTWTTTASMNEARYYHTATLLNDGRVLVVGGALPSSLDECELYDPTTGTWAVGPSSGSRFKHAATLLPDGTVLVTGGSINYQAFNEASIYNPTTNTWSVPSGFMNMAHFFHTATLLTDGTVLVAGSGAGYVVCGHLCETPSPTVVTEVYNPATGKFTRTGNLNQARWGQTSVLLSNEHLLTEGGGGATTQATLNSSEFYVPLTLTISSYSLNFSFQEVGVTSPAQVVNVTNSTTSRTVTFKSIVAKGDYTQTNVCPAELTPGQSCAITVTFTPTVTGTRHGSIVLTDNSLASGTQVIALTGVGETNAISFSPASLNFGQVPQNTSSKPLSVTLVNDGAAAVNISSIAVSPADGTYTQTNNCPATLPANQSCSLQVVFTPPDVGTFNATVQVTANAPGSPQSLPLTGVGLGN